MQREKQNIVIGANDEDVSAVEPVDVFHVIRAAVMAPIILTVVCVLKGYLFGEWPALAYATGPRIGFSGAEAAAGNLLVLCVYTGFMPLWIQTGVGVLAGIFGPVLLRNYSRWMGTVVLISAIDMALLAIVAANGSPSLVIPVAEPVIQDDSTPEP